MTTEATFRIWTGDKSVDVRTTTEGVSLEALLDLEDGAALESSVYLRVPDPTRPAEIRSFRTAMRSLEVVKGGDSDQELRIIADNAPSLDVVNGVMELRLTRELVEQPQDKRRTLAGNLGLLYSLSLYLLEKKHGIVSYHSSALVDERNKLVFINGGDASSGKSLLMLDYMARYGPGTDYRVLSTEMGHISIRDGEMRAYGGAAVDNVSLFSRQPSQAALMARLFPNVALPDPDADVDVRGTDGSVKTPLSVKDYYARQPSYSSRDGYRLVYVLANIKRRHGDEAAASGPGRETGRHAEFPGGRGESETRPEAALLGLCRAGVAAAAGLVSRRPTADGSRHHRGIAQRRLPAGDRRAGRKPGRLHQATGGVLGQNSGVVGT